MSAYKKHKQMITHDSKRELKSNYYTETTSPSWGSVAWTRAADDTVLLAPQDQQQTNKQKRRCQESSEGERESDP